MAEHMDKTTLLHKIRTRQAEFESILAPLNETQMITPGVDGEWSIKDVLAHLTAWQKRQMERVEAAIEKREPTITPVTNDEEINALNEQFYQENKARPLAEVLADWRATHMLLLERVQVLSEEDLNDPHRFAWSGGRALWEIVAANSYDHNHIRAIEQWLVMHR